MIGAPSTGLFVGSVSHRRFTPVGHAFTYPVFMPLIDIDRIPELMAVSRLSAYNRWSWASFHERDHFGDPGLALRDRLRRDAAAAGVTLPDGRILLLTNLRYLGYAFNPVSFFYCYGADAQLQAVLAEVNNTFGESHNYWLTESNRLPSGHAFRYAASKAFHVSPFMPMSLDYEFAFTPPEGRIVAHISTFEAGMRTLEATLTLEGREWSPGEIRRALVRHPWLTGKVIAAIHYEALRLYLKRAPFHQNPSRARKA
jgi:DUF1365 family protein